MPFIDLSKTIEDGMETYPGDPEVQIDQHAAMPADEWNLLHLSLGSHTGTHVDAPAHMTDGETVDSLALDRCAGKCVVADGVIDDAKEGVALAFRRTDITLEVARSIVRKRANFIIVGDGAGLRIEAEKFLLENNVITFTDLVNMQQLPDGEEFMFFGFPLKIKNGDGSPVRAVAYLDKQS